MPETIWLTAQAKAIELQARLDAHPEGASVGFAPRREYPGPVVLNKALVLEGGGATLWALVGPVLTVRAAVCLCNLRIEVTGDALTADAAACAIIVAPGGHLTLKNVEVRGLVRGLPQEEGVWHYPHGLGLGGIAPGRAHDWRLSLRVPTDCTIESHISGLKVTPSELRAGVNDLQVHIDPLPRDFLIDGHLLLSTAALRRRIAITAYADESPGAPRGQGQVIWVPPVEFSPPTVEPTALLDRPPTAPTGLLTEASTGALPAPGTLLPQPTPVQPQPRDKTPRLRRDQRPSSLFADTNRTSMPTAQTAKDESSPQRDQIPSQYFVEMPKPVAEDHELDAAHQELTVPERYLEAFNPTVSKISRQISPVRRESLVGSLFEVNNEKPQQQYNRRLPIYVLLDTSKNMEGEPIEAIRQGIKALLADLRSDPQAIETAWLSLITFDKDARQLVPLTELMSFVEPSLQVSKESGVKLGKAIYILDSCLDREINLPKSGRKGDWKALVLIMISDNPTDNINESILLIKQKSNLIKIQIIACGPRVNYSIFSCLDSPILRADTLQSDSFKAFFKWETIPLPLIGQVFSK